MGRLAIGLSALLLSLAACVQAAQSYALVTGVHADGATGSVEVEQIEGGRKLVIVELDQLPPPERVGVGMREFVVWMVAEDGSRERAGTLHYDRNAKAGNLMATTTLPRFTVRVTGERDANVTTPSSVLLCERKVVLN
jgi:hypothetical protein